MSLYVITGANRGFGRATALLLASSCDTEEQTLVLVGRAIEPLQRVKQEILAQTPRAKVQVIAEANLDNASTTQQSVLEPLRGLTKVWTSSKHATLICNAGSTGDLSKTVAEYTAEEIQAYFDMNVVSYTTLISGFLDLFVGCKTCIVNISSLLAVQPFANWGLYASGKAARDMLLQVIAKENKKENVRTLSYAPGPLDNTMQKHVRETLGDPEQAKLYSDMAAQGKLVSMEASAQKLVNILKKDTFVSGAHIDYFDDDI